MASSPERPSDARGFCLAVASCLMWPLRRKRLGPGLRGSPRPDLAVGPGLRGRARVPNAERCVLRGRRVTGRTAYPSANGQPRVALVLMFQVPDHMSSDGRVKSIALESLNQVWDVDNRRCR